jgi:hypothetical protein
MLKEISTAKITAAPAENQDAQQVHGPDHRW